VIQTFGDSTYGHHALVQNNTQHHNESCGVTVITRADQHHVGINVAFSHQIGERGTVVALPGVRSSAIGNP